MGLNHLPILLILAVVALIVFGPKRLPELGHGLGKAITEFKKGVADLTTHDADHAAAPPTAAVPGTQLADPSIVADANNAASVAKVR